MGTVYTTAGREEIAFVNSNVAGRLVATFVTSIGALSPPLPGGPAYVRVEKNMTIRKVTLLTYGGTGSCVVDIWKEAYSGFPPASSDSICGASKPQIVSGIKYEDSALPGWSVNLTAGDVLAFDLVSCSVFTKVVCILETDS